MPINLTPVQTLALAGLLKNNNDTALNQQQGFSVSESLITAVGQFGTAEISGISQSCLNNNGPAVIAAIKQLPGCLTGYADAALRSQFVADIDYNNIVNAVLYQAQSLDQFGMMGLIKNFQSAYVFCSSSYNTLSMINTAGRLNLAAGDLGFLFNNFDDLVTMGISNQFGSLSSAGFQQLVTNIEDFGTMFSTSDLASCFSIPSLIRNLFNHGFVDDIVRVLNQDNISVDRIDVISNYLLTAALNKLQPVTVKRMIAATNYRAGSGKVPVRITDVLDPEQAFGGAALGLVPTFDALSTKLVAVFGQRPAVKTMSELGKTLKSFQQPNLKNLTRLNSDRVGYTNAFNSASLSALGTGTGPYKNPTMRDVIGSYIGDPYTALIQNLLDIQSAVITTNEGQAVIKALAQASVNRADTAKDAELGLALSKAVDQLITSTNVTIRRSLNVGIADFKHLLSALAQERQNQQLAGITASTSNGSISECFGFVVTLATLYQDPEQIGYGDLVRKACADNIYGDAIKNAIIEGYNQSIMDNLGVEVSNVVDPSQFSGPDQDSCCP